MEFISSEEFLKQPVEVREVFINWWKPSVGDLFMVEKIVSFYGDKHNFIECFLTGFEVADLTEIERKRIICPLFTEGQLRKFIEDKTNGKVESYYAWDYYTIAIRDTECGGDDPQYDTEETDLLQALWKLACEIAKESVENE